MNLIIVSNVWGMNVSVGVDLVTTYLFFCFIVKKKVMICMYDTMLFFSEMKYVPHALPISTTIPTHNVGFIHTSWKVILCHICKRKIGVRQVAHVVDTVSTRRWLPRCLIRKWHKVSDCSISFNVIKRIQQYWWQSTLALPWTDWLFVSHFCYLNHFACLQEMISTVVLLDHCDGLSLGFPVVVEQDLSLSSILTETSKRRRALMQ